MVPASTGRPQWICGNRWDCECPESGTYTVTATGGCPTSADVVVDLTIQPIVQINEVGDVCDGKITLGRAEVTNPQAGATYTFNWDNGSNSNSITVDASGTYSVTARIQQTLLAKV